MLCAEAADVLATVQELAQVAGCEIVLIGAGAKSLLFDWRYTTPLPRTTTDWDLAIVVSDWEQYSGFVSALCAGPAALFEPAREPQRVVHKATGVLVDLVPFGAVARDEELTWPGTGRPMSTLGLADALRTAEPHAVGERQILVAAIPSLIALKLISYADRAAPRDLEDVDYILRHYAVYADDDRVYDLVSKTLSFDDCGPWLIGLDLARACGAKTLACVLSTLDDLLRGGDTGPLGRLVGRSLGDDWDERFAEIRRRFEVLAAALNEEDGQ